MERKTESTRKNWDCGSVATVSGTRPQGDVQSAGKPRKTKLRLLAMVYLPEYQSPSLNRILSKHWTFNLKNKHLCREMMQSISWCFAVDIPGCSLMKIIWLPPLSRSGTPLQRKSSKWTPTRKKRGFNGSTGRSGGSRGRR